MCKLFLSDEAATVQAGVHLGEAIGQRACVVFFQGDLGAGKTTLCRGVLRSFAYSGAVKSPTYTLVEPYYLANNVIYHFDLYRLGHPEELEFIGVRDYFNTGAICLVEWWQRGVGYIPEPDVVASLQNLADGRELSLQGKTALGGEILAKLNIATSKN